MTTLKQMLSQDLVIAPGVYDGLSAKLANLAGFKAVYASGGAIARSTATPDIGLLSLTEVVNRLADIVRASEAPVIADADTGFGNELNVARTIAEYEKVGVAALHLEDQTFPKRCGHLDGKTLISSDEMCLKIKAAVASRTTDLLIIARTDAIAVEGFDAALARAKAYAAAGADMLFVEAPQTVEQVEKIAAALPNTLKLINMFYGGKTPLIPADDLKTMGYNLVIIPSDLQRAAIKAMQKTLEAIKKEGDSSSMAEELATFDDREAIVETKKYLDFSKALK